jgi:hypothetical protein
MSAPVGCGMSLVKRREDPIRRDPARAHGHTSRFVLGLGGQGSVPAGATRRPPANSSPRPPDGPDHVDWGPSERLSSKRAPTGMADEDEQGEHRMPAGSRACGPCSEMAAVEVPTRIAGVCGRPRERGQARRSGAGPGLGANDAQAGPFSSETLGAVAGPQLRVRSCQPKG